jgi:CRISPR system Cascade subunit CasA
MESRFNLIDEPWIPVADEGLVSLGSIFSNSQFRSLGGNAVQKVAMMKLLLAIAQASYTPTSDEEWRQLGWTGLATHCANYLRRWYDKFYLYGDAPFLQVLAIGEAKLQSYGAVLPEISTGNTTVLTQGQIEQPLEDAEKALLLVCLMAFALGGKKADNSVVLGTGYQGKTNDKGKPSTGRPGPAVAHMGLLHNFCLGESVQQSLWFNLLTQEDISSCGYYPAGLGSAPWEQMPTSENCPVALDLQRSLMGRLVPVCRFCLLTKDGLHYSEGIAHRSYLEGMVDPSIAVDFSLTKPKVLWVNPEKRPWREITALLGFYQQQSSGFSCLQLRAAIRRVTNHSALFAIWSGGLKVSSNAGEQYASGRDDSVESTVWLASHMIGEAWFQQLKVETDALEAIAKHLYGCTAGYFKQQLKDGASHAAQATNLFWQLCEREFQGLISSCEGGDDLAEANLARYRFRRHFAANVNRAYNQYCPHDSARQLDAWAKCQPKLYKYLEQKEPV